MKRTGLCFGFLGLAGALLAGSSTGSVDSRWNFHGWPGYLPNPVRTIVPGEGGRGASRFVDVAGRDGMCVVSPEAYPVHAGNTVVVEFRARGCGTATVTLHRATEKGAWNATTGDVTVRLEKEWQTYRVRTVVLDGSNGATRSVRVALGARTGAAEVVFGDVEVEVLPTALSVDERPFDPVVEGWPLVWRDEFDGKEVDWSRWFTFPPSQPKSYASLDGEGHLLIKADRKEGRKEGRHDRPLVRPHVHLRLLRGARTVHPPAGLVGGVLDVRHE